VIAEVKRVKRTRRARPRADCAFHDFWTIWDSPAVFVGTKSGSVRRTACLLDRCSFVNNTNTAGVVKMNDVYRDAVFYGGVVAGDSDCHIGLRNATFSGSYGADVGRRDASLTLVYSNPLMRVHLYRPPQNETSLKMRRALQLVPGSPWVNVSDQGYRSIVRVRSSAERLCNLQHAHHNALIMRKRSCICQGATQLQFGTLVSPPCLCRTTVRRW
jgi:hypothetical protein